MPGPRTRDRRLARALDLVLVDATRPWGLPPDGDGEAVRAVLPRGLLREPPAALARADAIVLTRADQVDAATFHEEVARALVEYVADRFNRSATGLTYDLADELLSQRNVDVELRRRYRACLETCDFARFVPASAKSERRSEVLEQALALLAELERAW